MLITIKLFATLRNNREKIMSLDLKEGSTPLEVSQVLKIPEEDVAIIMINGRGAKKNSPLKEGDVLALFPPVGGG